MKSFTYDNAGRTKSVTTSAGTTNLDYDYEGRLTTITYPNTSTNTFTYNGLDTRVSKTDSLGTASYMRDGADVTDPVINDGTANYTPGISERRSSATKFMHCDRLGSMARLTDSTQATTDTRQYDAFGMLVSSSGSTSTPFGFVAGNGYQTDADSGLMLLGHRYYDPSTGRFLTRDPARAGRNWTSYASNNPLRFIDSTGLDDGDGPWLEFGKWVDNHIFGGAIADAGDAEGKWEAGQGSGWVAVGKCAYAAFQVVDLAVELVDGTGKYE